MNPPPWIYIVAMAPFIAAIGTASTRFVTIPYNLLKGYSSFRGTGMLVDVFCLGFAAMALGVLVVFWKEFLRQRRFAQFLMALMCWFLTFACWLLIVEVIP